MQLLSHCNRAAALLAGFALLFMAVLGAADVIAGRGFNRPIPGLFEMTETLMVFSIFLALALAQHNKRHIRVEIVLDWLPPRGKSICDLLNVLLVGVFFAFIAWFGWDAAIYSFTEGQYRPGAIRLPVWPAKTALAVGATLMILQCTVELVGHVRDLVRHGREGSA